MPVSSAGRTAGSLAEYSQEKGEDVETGKGAQAVLSDWKSGDQYQPCKTREEGWGMRLSVRAQQCVSQVGGSLNLGHSNWGEWPHSYLKTTPRNVAVIPFVSVIPMWLALNCFILWVALNFNILCSSYTLSEEEGWAWSWVELNIQGWCLFDRPKE